jgi:predicted acetyltransferase
VTAVTTTSTHRRRGLATRSMAAELAASVDRGEHVSILIPAEWRIYGRFGYGASTEHQTWTVDALAAQVRHRPPGTVEYVDRDTARARPGGL